jgi:1,2-diacylglycerol 3-beta-galactosyltransferase
LTGTCILNLINNHPANTIVCCHPLLKAPIAQALEMTGSETSLVTLVTDLASGHASWFVSAGQACLVATEQARRRALTCGLSAESVTVTGLPVRPCFVDAAQRDQVVARRLLGLDSGSRVLLIVGGADGTGPFRRLLRALANEGVQAQTVVITGRNKRLQAELKRHAWSLPLRVEGFVDNIEQWMCAADLLVTKAGPATICEALVVGVPMVLNGALPGQEPPNVDYVTDSGAGIWAPGPTQAARAARNLFSSDGQTLREMSERAQETARADAAWRVARIVWRSASGTLA